MNQTGEAAVRHYRLLHGVAGTHHRGDLFGIRRANNCPGLAGGAGHPIHASAVHIIAGQYVGRAYNGAQRFQGYLHWVSFFTIKNLRSGRHGGFAAGNRP